MDITELRKRLISSEKVLIGLGEEWRVKDSRENEAEIRQAYTALYELLKEKDYFIITMAEDALIFDTELESQRITAPLADDTAENEYLSQWELYLQWLGKTLGKELLILELGVGFSRPDVIRFPFEKTAFFNQKSRMVRVNETFPQITKELAERAEGVKESSAAWVQKLCGVR